MTTHNYIEIEGLKIFYREAGAKDAPTILLLHGFPSSSHMYRELIPNLANNFHLLAPDYPGFGYSDAPSPEIFTYTFDHLAEVMEKFIQAVGLQRFSVYMQDYGAPVGLRLAARHPEWIEALITQNGNAYAAGISSAFEPLKPFWANRNEETEKAARALLQSETTIFQYTHGVRNPQKISPDAWTMDQRFLDRSGNAAIQLELLHNYPSNLALYPEWHTYFRKHQPPTLVVWGKNDPFFSQEGALAYKEDLKNIEVHLLDTGHFALEEDGEVIATLIKNFLKAQAIG
ncbi:MAG: alpha/beta hydrolase [Acidobacteria bacterium]|nr:alpha/beta hydrolase [Acidobacteriota bacterium]